MNRLQILTAFALVALVITGCNSKAAKTAVSDGKEIQVASYKSGKGVILNDETQKLLALEVADVKEMELENELHFTLQMFGERHHPNSNPQDHSLCDEEGSGFISSEVAAALQLGQPVYLRKATNAAVSGVVLSVRAGLAPGESEIVVGVSNAAARFQNGEFLAAKLNLPHGGTVATVPQAALLRTVEGTFVYAVNGGAYFRTAVKTGRESGGWVEITDGLLTGDQVVTKAVESLWLIELRATKGGDACTH